jgi:hypothetical protein
MSDIAELERRLTVALDRIAVGAERLREKAIITAAVLPDNGIDMEKMRASLDAERAANAQLSERVNVVKQRQETTLIQLERRLARLTEQLDLQSLEMLRLKKANSKLMDANSTLRESQVAGSAESIVVNRSLSAELDALRAERRAEMAEMEEILAEIKPLLNAEVAHG